MYCPRCLTGYPAGVSACARCGALLVAELPPHQGTENREELVTVLVIEDSFGLKLATAALDEAGIGYAVAGDDPGYLPGLAGTAGIGEIPLWKCRYLIQVAAADEDRTREVLEPLVGGDSAELDPPAPE